jgi:hypothetical protein
MNPNERTSTNPDGVRVGVPTWQQRAAERAAFERGVSAMRDVAVTVIRARHESGYSCDPWKLVEAIRAAKEPTDPAGVALPDGGQR